MQAQSPRSTEESNVQSLLPNVTSDRAVEGHDAGTALVSAREVLKLLRLTAEVAGPLDNVKFPLRRVHRGESAFRAGDRFHSIYVVRSGFFKSVMFDPFGAEQVLAFPMQGDLLGADGLANGSYTSEPIALDDAEVVIIPFAKLESAARECPGLDHAIYRVISREIVRDQGIQWILGTLGAEARVAAFLLGLAERFGALGYSRSSFHLRMTRQEIGSYLGLKLETVSRALSAFDAAGLISVRQKAIDITDAATLRSMFEAQAAGNGRSGCSRPVTTTRVQRTAIAA